MNTIFKETEKILKDAKIEEYKAEGKMIVLGVSNLTMEEILLLDEIPNKEKILEIARKRATTKAPLQHILGYCYFMGEKYKVNKNVLIPRDETEILVEKAYNLIKNKNEKINILDIGIGSGCISCALAKKLQNHDIEILGVDISLEALEIALENINNLNLVRKVIIRKSDIFSKIRDFEKFDLIVSNPPYIPLSQKDSLESTVKDFEPHLALFSDDEKGINFYKKIIQNAKNYLKKDGFLAFELGINQSTEVKELLLNQGFKNIEIEKDLAGIERVILAKN